MIWFKMCEITLCCIALQEHLVQFSFIPIISTSVVITNDAGEGLTDFMPSAKALSVSPLLRFRYCIIFTFLNCQFQNYTFCHSLNYSRASSIWLERRKKKLIKFRVSNNIYINSRTKN